MTDRAPVPAVEARRLSRWFGQKVAVSEVSCAFEPGVTGLLGPNGAGKTTLLRMLIGLVRPSDGTVRLLGEDPRSRPQVYRHVALVPEDEAVPGFLTAREFARMNAALQGLDDPDAAARKALEQVDLSDAADRKLATFSKGMRQRAKVAAVLVHEPSVLLLDEPLNGTDPVQRARLMETFRSLGEEGRTVIVSSHVLAEVERMTERVVAMIDGRLAGLGTVSALRAAMSDIPRKVRVGCAETRALAAALVSLPSVAGVSVDGDSAVEVDVLDSTAFGRALAGAASQAGVLPLSVEPQDESLESTFRYLVDG